jgi:hypothetical protein
MNKNNSLGLPICRSQLAGDYLLEIRQQAGSYKGRNQNG